MFGLPGGLEWIVILLLIAVPWVFALIDILRHKFEGNGQILWLLVVIFIPFGFVFYFLIGRSKRLDV